MPSCSEPVGVRRAGGASPMSRKPEQRILSVWWPRLAIERWRKTSGHDFPPDAPVVLTVEGTHGLVISAVTEAAAPCGARAGARLAAACAHDPGPHAVPADPAGDEALVERLARWAARWSPLVEVDGRDPSASLGTGALRLDVTGAAHLFGGEAALVEDAHRRFTALGLTSRVAIAPTPGAAWALARFSNKTLTPTLSRAREREGAAQPRKGEGSSDLAAALAPLPVAA